MNRLRLVSMATPCELEVSFTLVIYLLKNHGKFKLLIYLYKKIFSGGESDVSIAGLVTFQFSHVFSISLLRRRGVVSLVLRDGISCPPTRGVVVGGVVAMVILFKN